MYCITCQSAMVNVDDVNEESVRIDWVKCPKCNSTAEIIYGNNGRYIEKVIWKR